MHEKAIYDVAAGYYLSEDHFFAATCASYRRHSAGINTYFAGETSVPWNMLFIRVGNAPLRVAMGEVVDLIRATSIPIRMAVPQERLDGLRDVLVGLGFQPVEKSIAMVRHVSCFAPSVSEEGVQISLTRNLNDWAVPLGDAFCTPSETVTQYQARHQRALDVDESLYHFTLSVDGQVGCSLTLSLCEGEARLSDVGTLTGFRGRGYATQLIQAALLHAWSLGARRCFLEASMAAVPLYRRLGFQPLFDYASFVRGADVKTPFLPGRDPQASTDIA